MPRRRKTTLLIAAAVLFVVTVGILTNRHDGEPYADGHSLSYWIVLNSPDAPDQDEATAAANAIRQIGTNAIPHLLDWIQYQQSSSTRKRLAVLNRPINWIQNLLGAASDWSIQDSKVNRIDAAVRAFSALAPKDAAVAIPELNRLIAESPINQITLDGSRAFTALAAMGGPGVAPLLAARNSTNHTIRIWAFSAVPVALTTEPYFDPPIPLLIEALTNEDYQVVMHATTALRLYGDKSRPAVPILIEKLNHPQIRVRISATNTLRLIAPEVLPTAPVQ